jgi:hypothetical protein
MKSAMKTKTKQPSGHGGARPGAGRPKTYRQPSLPTSILFEQVLRDRLDRQARRLGLTRTAAVQQAVRQWLGD